MHSMETQTWIPLDQIYCKENKNKIKFTVE